LRVENIIIRNFRNIEILNQEIFPGLNIFIGENAQGKTNILEALYLLASGTSFRTNIDFQLLKFDESAFYIKARYSYNDRAINAELKYDLKRKKNVFINSKRTGQSNIDRLRVVLFTPDDLYLIKGSPSKRRNFIDFSLKQISQEYRYLIENYSKIIKKRNLLLKKEQTNTKSFKLVEEIFIETSARIILDRINLVNILDETTNAIFKEINYSPSKLKIRYALSFPVDSGKINLDILKNCLFKHIKNNSDNEKTRKKSLVGPHLDDINIYQDEKLARQYASQGQQRTIAVSLKLAEIIAFKKIKNYYPVFLLDEVLAELDESKKIKLLNYLLGADFQSFLTAVKIPGIDTTNAARFLVENGCLKRKEQT
jgi:DNA replication and repair protein RecF